MAMKYWLACLLTVLPYTAGAEEIEPRRRFGLNVRVGTTGESADSVIGAVVHLGDRLILRPSLRYANVTETRRTPGLEDRHTDGLWGFKLDALARFRRRGDVGPYAGLSFGYLDPRSSTSHDDAEDDEASGLSRLWTGDVVVGAQYAIHEKIGVYGEAGLRWMRLSSMQTVQISVSSFNGGIGVAFYF
jgi:outer membrane protein with beta-barrel domain